MNYLFLRRLSAIIATTAALHLPGSAIAQTGSYNTPSFTETFDDPDGTTINALAKTSGLNVGEATRRLRLMNEAGRVVHALQARFPGTFSGAEAISSPDFRIAVYGTQEAIGSIVQATRDLVNASELSKVLDVRVAPASAAQTSAKARGFGEALRQRGFDAVIASNARTGQFKYLVKDPTAVLSALVSGSLRAEKGIKIEQFDGIVKTATEVPGGYGYNGSTEDCTRGFNVKEISGTLYGTSTAGHCDNSGTDAQTGVSQAFKQQWIDSNLDSQWSTHSGRTGYLIVPKFYNGSSIVTVTGGQSDYAGLYICKYGRITTQTCGFVDQYQYTDPGYGDFPRMNRNADFPVQALEGDSGGPVFYGSLGVGQVHGRDGGPPNTNPSLANMYYTPLRAWQANNLPIGIICSC